MRARVARYADAATSGKFSFTLHYNTLHYIILHCTELHYMTLHYIVLHYLTLQYSTVQYSTLHYITLHYITLHYITCEVRRRCGERQVDGRSALGQRAAAHVGRHRRERDRAAAAAAAGASVVVRRRRIHARRRASDAKCFVLFRPRAVARRTPSVWFAAERASGGRAARAHRDGMVNVVAPSHCVLSLARSNLTMRVALSRRLPDDRCP